jgi:hypothetical protein
MLQVDTIGTPSGETDKSRKWRCRRGVAGGNEGVGQCRILTYARNRLQKLCQTVVKLWQAAGWPCYRRRGRSGLYHYRSGIQESYARADWFFV